MSGRKPVMAYTRPEWINREGVQLKPWPKRSGQAQANVMKAKALLKRLGL